MRKINSKKITLVFDLDETLVRTVFVKDQGERELMLQSGQWITLNVQAASNLVIPYLISIRPYALEMLKSLKKDFELIIFTASDQRYMNAVVELFNKLTRRLKLFDFALGRNYLNGLTGPGKIGIKDLNILLGSRDVKDIIIIDNKETGCFP